MKIKSLKHNFLMYSLRGISGIFFTLLVFPYVARVLGPENLGKVQFVESIVIYFLLFINLGVPAYAKREISFLRENKHKRSKLVLELLTIRFMSTILVTIFYFITINYVPYFKDYKILFYIFYLKIFFNCLDVEWFYVGIENQEYITKRSLIFKLLSSVAIFLLIKEKGDYSIYAAILVLSFMGSNLLNFKKIFDYISLGGETLKDIKIKRHFNPIILFFTTSFATSLFSSLDSIMVRVFLDEKSLGYYSIASKIGKMPLMLIIAIFTVLYPRLCNLMRTNEYNEYDNLKKKGLNFSMLVAIPLTVVMFVLASEIIQLLVGSEFSETITIFRIFSFLIPVMSLAYFTGNTLLINLKEKIYMKGQIIASITNVIFNCLFISLLGASGAALATVLAEMIAIIYRIRNGGDIFSDFRLINRNNLKILLAGLFMGTVIHVLNINLAFKLYLQLVVLITLGGIIYLLCLFILKEKNTFSYIKGIEKLNF